MRHLQQVVTENRDRGVTVIGINNVDNEEIARTYLKELKITFPNALDASEKAIEISRKYQTLEGMSGVPLTYVIDRKGRVADAWYGGNGSLVSVIENCLGSSKAGRVHIRIEGFKKVEGRDFALCLQEDREGTGRYQSRRIGTEGIYEETRTLNPGPWIASFTFSEQNFAVRRFDVKAGETSEVTIHRDSLEESDSSVDLTGKLVYPDGAPVTAYGISLFGLKVPGLPQEQRSVVARTDAAGAFHVMGLKPGHWWVRANIEDNPGEAITSFRDLFLTSEGGNPFPLNLTFPRGKVKGELYDASTGKPLKKDEKVRWWAFLNDLDKGIEACELQNGHTGSRLVIPGVPAGRYQLVIMVPGAYRNYKSAPFTTTEGQELDLGRINLTPAK